VPWRGAAEGPGLRCAQTKMWGCSVVVPPEADMKAVGLTMEIILRHETVSLAG
jgi:hypothetical protein